MNFLKSLIILCLISISLVAQTLRGTITLEDTGFPAVGANVVLPSILKGAAADIDGNYEIKNIDPGKYLVEILYVGCCNNSDSITIDSSSKILERNYLLRQSPKKTMLQYNDYYFKYHKKINKALSDYDSTFFYTFKIIQNDDAIFFYPQFHNNYHEDILLPDRIDYFKIYINDKEFDLFKSVDIIGCSFNYPLFLKEYQIKTVEPDSVEQIGGFFISKKDLPLTENKNITLKLVYNFKLPVFFISDICRKNRIEQIKEKYLKVFNSQLKSKETVVTYQ